MKLEPIRHAYHQAAGRWRGCDWPTRLGTQALDLSGLTSADAKSRTAIAQPEEVDDWHAAASWLQEVERAAEQAEMEAALALAAANAGDLTAALCHARRASEREGLVGRPHHDACWHRLERAIEEALQNHGAETRSDALPATRPSLEREVSRLQEEVRRLGGRLERAEEALAILQAT